MVARIVAVLTQKGGAGKTMISYNLSEGLQRRGFRVLLIDADPQNSSVKVRNRFKGESSGLAVMSLAEAEGNLYSMVKPFREAFDIIVVDGPPSHTAPQTRSAASMADLTLIPFCPGAQDLDSTVETSAQIQDVYDGRNDEPTPTYIVINRNERTNLANIMVSSVSAKTGFPLADARLFDRVAYGESTLSGVSVEDSKDSAAKAEFAALINEVLAKLELANFSAEIA